ncbi:MAG TPA: hypothetical protein VG409_18550 [Actinomycetota bacterium]|nr:hypothetical protein [Actinomycetota bacterium]
MPPPTTTWSRVSSRLALIDRLAELLRQTPEGLLPRVVYRETGDLGLTAVQGGAGLGLRFPLPQPLGDGGDLVGVLGQQRRPLRLGRRARPAGRPPPPRHRSPPPRPRRRPEGFAAGPTAVGRRPGPMVASSL